MILTDRLMILVNLANLEDLPKMFYFTITKA
jgi:hypothetical protein